MAFSCFLEHIKDNVRRVKIENCIANLLSEQTTDEQYVPLQYDDIPHSLEYTHESKLHHMLCSKKKGAEAAGRKQMLMLLHFMIKFNDAAIEHRRGCTSVCEDYVILIASTFTPCMHHIMAFFPHVRVILIQDSSQRIYKYIPKHRDGLMARNTCATAKYDLEASLDIFIDVSRKQVINIRVDVDMGFLVRLRQYLVNRGIERIGLHSDIQMLSAECPSDMDILWCMARQGMLMHHLSPIYASLKFKLPFYCGSGDVAPSLNHEHSTEFKLFKDVFGVDLLQAYRDNKYTYLRGDIYLQPFGSGSSTETRLHVRCEHVGANSAKSMDHTLVAYPTSQEYENRMFYYNSIQRVFGDFKNPLTPSNSNVDVETENGRYDKCASCAIERTIWKSYHDTVKPICVETAIENLSSVLGKDDVHEQRRKLSY